MSNIISANFIGVDITGNSALPNGGDGVLVTNNASSTIVGGDADGEGNVIVGGGSPVKIEAGAFNTIVQEITSAPTSAEPRA